MAVLDTPKPLCLKDTFVGIKHWEPAYGYEEHRRFPACINEDSARLFVMQTTVLIKVAKALFDSPARPYAM